MSLQEAGASVRFLYGSLARSRRVNVAHFFEQRAGLGQCQQGQSYAGERPARKNEMLRMLTKEGDA